MKDILQLEFRRLFRAKAFYICVVISLLLILISAATSKLMLGAIDTEELPDGVSVSMMVPTAYSMMKGIGSSSVTMLLAVFVSIFVAEDYVGDTIKNVFARGYTRTNVFFAKYVATLVGCVIFIAATALFSLLIGATFFDGMGTAGENYVGSFLAILFCLVAYVTVYFMIAISIRKTGAAIALSIFGPMIVGLLFSLFSAILKIENVDLADYWLTDRVLILQAEKVTGKDVLIGCILAFIVTAASGVGGYFINEKREN